MVKYMKKNLDVTKPCSEQILPVPWPFMKWRFHCIIFSCFKLKQETIKILCSCYSAIGGWKLRESVIEIFQVTMTFVLLKLTKNSDFFPNFVLTFFL